MVGTGLRQAPRILQALAPRLHAGLLAASDETIRQGVGTIQLLLSSILDESQTDVPSTAQDEPPAPAQDANDGSHDSNSGLASA